MYIHIIFSFLFFFGGVGGWGWVWGWNPFSGPRLPVLGFSSAAADDVMCPTRSKSMFCQHPSYSKATDDELDAPPQSADNVGLKNAAPKNTNIKKIGFFNFEFKRNVQISLNFH